MQCLARAHANCCEGLPVFGGLLWVALMLEKTAVTDGLAVCLLTERVTQSTVHLMSTRAAAISARSMAFAVQMGRGVYWIFGLFAERAF